MSSALSRHSMTELASDQLPQSRPSAYDRKAQMEGGRMATLQEAVAKKFIKILEEDERFDQSKTAKLEALLKADGKLKPDDLTAIFALPEGGEIL